MEIKEELDECPDLLIPGQYCKVRINIVYNPRNITIIGVCLLSENENIHLQGKVIKNKWQKGDLKTNTPQFISVGWWRFQTIPLFSQDDRVQKYLRSSMAPLYGEIAFYGPSVAVGTSFFIYSYTGKYRILASGRILNTSGIVTVKKKLKLLGYPKTTTGNTAIIQSMFSSEKEVSKFTGAKLACASGLRGILKTATGHGGDFRATFEGSLLLSDTVFIKCYVPVKPYSYVCHTGEGVTYLRSMKEIKESQGIPLYEESASESFERIVEPAVKGRSGDRGDLTRQRRICELEQKLPFKMRAPVVIKESIDLPISPDQRAMTVKKEEILQMRKILDEEEENVRRRACDLARKKKLEAIEEKLVRKRKLALEGKQNFENAYKKNKKAHKKSKRKKK
ncbi:ribosome biogenesis protein BMS1 [Pancytospora epiphaga]|nr:ribosome biogenesis protein BMS1 [Pancytospora epiphaga]